MDAQDSEDGPAFGQDLTEQEARQRNSFIDTLPTAAQERFLAALADASERGMSPPDAWREALIAAEVTYTNLPPHRMPPIKEEEPGNL